jgi:uncharacterized protein (TIGR02145 family)
LATVTTSEIIGITETSASSGGNITSDGGADITARGVCWSTSAKPTTADSKTMDGTGSGSFTSSLTGLTGNTRFYIRAYATNRVGTSYGNEVSFKTSLVLPTVTTTAVSVITSTTASSGGNITSNGGESITTRGVCWSTSQNPTIADNKTADGTGSGSFTSNLTGLTGNTTYYVRAYATNSLGTNYGEEESFSTLEVSGTFTDSRDSIVYNWVTIGIQTWMAENLAYLPSVSLSSEGSEMDGFYYVYDYEGSSFTEAKTQPNYTTYGVLYNWEAAKTACPSGWHLPGDEDWTALADYLGTSDGGKMKETGTAHWLSPNTGATNESGFTALPGGNRNYGGGFSYLGSVAYFWSASLEDATYALFRRLTYDFDGHYRIYDFKSFGFSVRCIKD